jgi:hypothetical protein
MKNNESLLDRIIRIVLGIVLVVLFLAKVVTGWMGIVFVVLGAIALITGAIGFCPLYGLFKFSTKKS